MRLRRAVFRLYPRNWRVRWRLLALVIIPTVAAIGLGAFRILAAENTAAGFARVNQLAVLGGDVTALAQSIEDERDITVGYIAEGRSSSLLATLTGQYAVTDRHAADVQSLARQIGSAYPAVVRTDLAFAQNRIQALSDVRDLAHSQISALPMITDYSNVIAALLAFDDEIAVGSSNAQLAETVISFGSLAQMEEDASQQRGILYAALIQRQFGLGGLNALVAEQSDQASDLAAFDAEAASLAAYGVSGGLTEVQQFNDVVAGPAVDSAESIEQDAVIIGDNNAQLNDSPQNWYSDMSGTLDDIRSVESEELASIAAQSNASHQGAEGSVRLTVILVLGLLFLVLMITIFMARSMSRPLRRLRADALEVAARRLPEMVRRLRESHDISDVMEIEPIGINSTDEIGEVARAFDQVHREAVRLAADEAMLRTNLNDMFVNLSRRSQSLIERQLGIIDSLEQSEQDPDRLSSLFRLDHLATRMRRNSENLLVLAGHDSGRRRSQPVPLVDVLRAAVSEIEQYERVFLNVQPGIMIAGRAVSDVVHLAAELVENATTFSHEEMPVSVTGQMLSSGGVLLEITDSGVGISDQELAHANWRLDNPPVVDVAVSRRMGLFVVGRLAARHGVRVRLQHAQNGGLTALIWLPETTAEPEPAPPLSTLRRRFDVDSYGPGTSRPVQAPGMHAPLSQAAPRSAVAQVPPSSPVSAPAPPPFQASTTAPQPVLPAAPGGKLPTRTPATPAAAVPFQAPSPAPHQAGQESSGAEGNVAATGSNQRLPIFNSVESDWFRRSGATLTSSGGSSSAEMSSWTSPADAGWRAAQVVAAPAAGDTTQAGLPKRVPRANLVPGSAGSKETESSDPTSSRSPETMRERMAKFQQGVREGRAAASQNPPDG